MKKIFQALLLIAFAAIAFFPNNLLIAVPLLVAVSAILSYSAYKNKLERGLLMAITATIVDIRGKAYEPIIEELLFLNSTIADKLVAFEEDVKSETQFTENKNTAVMQGYTSGLPTAAGTLGLTTREVSPTKVMFYQEFDPNSLRTSRFKRDMKKGAWNTMSSEFEKYVIANYGDTISSQCEVAFWCAISTATQTAIAALASGAGQGSIGVAEKAWAAAQTPTEAATTPFTMDGVIAKLMYSYGALGVRVKVAGTTINSSNIAAEYAKVYGAIPSLVMNGNKSQAPYIYAPYSHKQMIVLYNLNATYRDIFVMEGNKYFYGGTEIKFIPLPENIIIASRPDYIIWCTDMLSDINMMKIDKIALNREDMFIKNILTQASHVVNQRYVVLYVG